MRQATLFTTTILLGSLLAAPAVVPVHAQDRSRLAEPLDPVRAESVRREDLPGEMVAGCPSDPVSFYPCAKEKIETFNPPRTLDGSPNFQGFWNAERQAFNIEAHPVSLAYRGGPTLVIDPADGLVPYQPWAAAKQQERADNTFDPPSLEFMDPNSQCFLRGVPRQMWIMAYKFIQPPGSPFIFSMHEQNHAYRVIAMEERPVAGRGVKTWMGDSRGRWEDNTLVIETTGLNGRQWMDNQGNFYSDQVRIVERLAFVDEDTLLWEARIEDPTVYSQPWTMSFPIHRNATPGYELFEMACHEGNQSIELQLAQPVSR